MANLVDYTFQNSRSNPNRVFDGDLGVCSTLSVDGGGHPVGRVANRVPRHRWSATRSLKVDGGEDGRADRVVRGCPHVIRFKGLGGPHELSDVGHCEGGPRNASEQAGVTVFAAASARQGNNAMKRGACRNSDKRCEVGPAAIDVPRCNGPVPATTSGGGAVLKYRLQDGVVGGGLDRVEQEDSLALVGEGRGRNGPIGGKRRDGRAP